MPEDSIFCPIDGKKARLIERYPNGSVVYECGGQIVGASREGSPPQLYPFPPYR